MEKTLTKIGAIGKVQHWVHNPDRWSDSTFCWSWNAEQKQSVCDKEHSRQIFFWGEFCLEKKDLKRLKLAKKSSKQWLMNAVFTNTQYTCAEYTYLSNRISSYQENLVQLVLYDPMLNIYLIYLLVLLNHCTSLCY